MSKPKQTRYERIKTWYSQLSGEEKKQLRKRNPLLISTIELLVKLVEG